MTRPWEDVVEVGVENKAIHDRNKLDKSEIKDDEVDGCKIDDETGKKDQKTSKSKNLF